MLECYMYGSLLVNGRDGLTVGLPPIRSIRLTEKFPEILKDPNPNPLKFMVDLLKNSKIIIGKYFNFHLVTLNQNELNNFICIDIRKA